MWGRLHVTPQSWEKSCIQDEAVDLNRSHQRGSEYCICILQFLINLEANWQVIYVLFTHQSQFLLSINRVSVQFGPWTTLYPTDKRHMKLAVCPSALKYQSGRPCDCVCFSFSRIVWCRAAALFMHQTRSSWRNITAHFRSQTWFISHCLCLCIIIMCVRFCMEKKSQVSTCSFAGRAGVTATLVLLRCENTRVVIWTCCRVVQVCAVLISRMSLMATFWRRKNEVKKRITFASFIL